MGENELVIMTLLKGVVCDIAYIAGGKEAEGV